MGNRLFRITTADGKLPQGVDPEPADPAKYDFDKEAKKGVRRYKLQKFRRCNAGTCFNQKPIVTLPISGCKASQRSDQYQQHTENLSHRE